MNVQAYTDLVVAGDRLVVMARHEYSGMPEISGFNVVSHDSAVSVQTGKTYRLNRRGNAGALFVGNFKVMGRI